MATSYDYNNPFAALAARMPAVRLAMPYRWFFKFPPAPFPQTLPSPPDHPTLAHPFTISDNLYNALLDSTVPVTFAMVYITTITILNSVNKSRNYAPWAFSKTRLFKLLVISHNIILAVYSAWTFVGMLNALQKSVYNPYHEWGVAGTVDSLCKLNGPRGFGSAAVYNERSAAWSIANRFFKLGADGLGPDPDITDVGRIWNEGLAFYGWLFYISKFYEVIDTLIIIAKGKKSSFLQTYHHAGAMICMWAGIRYMSPPIWMFVLVNSFIHTIMYSFYLCTALGVRIPVWFKRTLTTLQITQFVVGAAYAFSHLFIEYQSPYSIATHHTPGSPVEDIVSDFSSVVSTATATVTANLSAHIKKALLRAAGREGLAENVLNEQGRVFGTDAEKAAKDLYKRQITEYRDDLKYVHCLDTSGQAFAIYLNVLYLLPLTVLFVRFFIKSYLRRLERRRSSTTVPIPIEKRAHDLRESFSDATKGARRSVLSLGGPQEGDEDTDNAIDDTEFEAQKDDAKREIKKEGKQAWRDLNDYAEKTTTSASQKLNKAKQKAGPAVEEAKKATQKASTKTSQTIQNISKDVNETVSSSKEGMKNTLEDMKQQADSVKAQTEPIVRQGLEKAEEVYETVKTSIVETKQSIVGDSAITDVVDTSKVREEAEQVKEQASNSAHQGAKVLRDRAEATSQSMQKAAASAKENVESSLESANAKIQESKPADASESSSPESDQKSTTKAETIHKSGTSKVAKTDKNAEKDQSVEHESEDETGPSGKEVEQESSKEQVRDSDPQKGSKTESSTGDAKEASTSSINTKSQDTQSEDVAASKESNQKNVSIENTNDKEHAGQVSSQEGGSQESDSQKDISEVSDATKEKSEGRQSLFKGERADALEKLNSGNSEASDKVIADDKEIVDGQSKPDDKIESKAQKSHTTKGNTRGNQHKFEQTRTNALEKLESANSQSQDNQKDAEHGQDFEDQKESWIDVGDEHAVDQKKSTSEQIKDASDEEASSKIESKTDSHAESSTHYSHSQESSDTKTENSTVKTESSEKTDGGISSEPEWFERLTASTDSPQKSNESAKPKSDDSEVSPTVVEGISFADKVKEHSQSGKPKAADGSQRSSVFDDTEGSKGDKLTTDESPADDKKRAEQDKIIAESEPVRDEVKQPSQKDEAEAGA